MTDPKPPLTIKDFQDAAAQIGCDPEVIMAIAEVETGWRPGKSGFALTPATKYEKAHVAPIILYERHIFSRLTKGKYDKTHPHLSHPRQISGTYGANSAQHGKLQEAIHLDEYQKTSIIDGKEVKVWVRPNREAALKSCSWGVFQVMGFNWELCGYTSLQEFISAMYQNDRAHLHAFLGFILGSGLRQALIAKDWHKIARVYNGAGYAKHGYHTKMAAAYARWKAKA